jgi:Family of unknown function (DUF6152)
MRKQLTRLPFVILALALAALVSVPVSAHHGWGGNSEQQSELTGTVEVPVSLAGPHATMKVRVDGQVWDITMAPPNRTQAAGLKEGIIPVGATVTVSGHKNKSANRYEMKTERVTWNGKVFAVYADRQ